MTSLIERHRDRIRGVLSSFDRIVIHGTLPSVCHEGAISTMLDSRDIRTFDYFVRFAQLFRGAICAHVARLAAHAISSWRLIRPTSRSVVTHVSCSARHQKDN